MTLPFDRALFLIITVLSTSIKISLTLPTSKDMQLSSSQDSLEQTAENGVSSIDTFVNVPLTFVNKKSNEENRSGSVPPPVMAYLVKNKHLASWLQFQGPDAYLVRDPSSSVLFLRHRVRRQTGPTGSGVSPTGSSPTASVVVTPVLPIKGSKKFNETSCMPWPDVAAIIRSPINPTVKNQLIDPLSCNMTEGLECLPFEEKGATVYRCKCQLVYGPKAVYTNYTDNTGRIQKGCFIPAGLGWDSECLGKSYNSYGYPLPFGDPAGTNAEPAAQLDAYNEAHGAQVIVAYIPWNSIKPKCVPYSECREKGTYRGQRCQCIAGHKLLKPEGKCDGVGKINHQSFLLWLVFLKAVL